MGCKESLDRGLCYRVREGSSVPIKEDQWILDLPNFRLPEDMEVSDNIQRVRELMQDDLKSWNTELIQIESPQHISNLILSIPIMDGEQESFVWCPSSSGCFLVRSSYRANNKEHFSGASRLDRSIWALLWKSKLDEKLKILVRKLLSGILPTKGRIQSFIPIPDLSCFLCNSSVENIDHLIFHLG